MVDPAKLDQLELAIIDVIRDTDVEWETAFVALQHVVAFWMSAVCSNCRRNAARELKSNIPSMLNAANQLAAMAKDQPTTCH
jgi:hypothetical protein